MTMTGLKSFDDTIHVTNVWLKELMARLGTDSRSDAYRALRVTLHALRDRIPNNEAVQLAAQLPTLIRGAYFEGWNFNAPPTDYRTQDEFIASLSNDFRFADVDLSHKAVVSEVFGLLRTKIVGGEMRDVMSCLPPQLRELMENAPVMGL